MNIELPKEEFKIMIKKPKRVVLTEVKVDLYTHKHNPKKRSIYIAISEFRH